MPPSDAETRIRQLAKRTAVEFHDPHLAIDAWRVVRIWRRSGLSADDFVACFHSARNRVQRNNTIVTRAWGAAGELGARNRMPYFLAVLETLAMLPAPLDQTLD